MWQSVRAADQLGLAANHSLRQLPSWGLQKVFLNGPSSLPGAFTFGFKETAQVLGALDKNFSTTWPGSLDSGLRAMVMGWKAYELVMPVAQKRCSCSTSIWKRTARR